MKRWALIVVAVLGLCLIGAAHAPSNSNWPNTFSVFQGVAPLTPAPQDPTSFPLGNDLWIKSFGSADLHSQTWGFLVTSTTSVTGTSSPQTITVGSAKLCPEGGPSDPSCISSPSAATAWFCPPTAGCTVTLDPDTASEETLSSSNWSILSGSTLSVSPAKSHTQPYVIRQMGALFEDARVVAINHGDVADRPLTVTDRQNNPILKVPNDLGGTFPANAFQVQDIVTGGNGANSDFLYRSAGTSSCFKLINNGNTFYLATFCDGVSGVLNLANATNQSMSLQGTADVPRIIGGGTSSGIRLDLSRSGTGTNGTLSVCNNSTDESCGWTVKPGDTATNKTVVTLGGALKSGTSSNTDMVGLITLSAGAGSYSFINSYSTAPVCFFADRTTHANTFTWAVSTTAITISAGTGSDVIQYHCVGLN